MTTKQTGHTPGPWKLYGELNVENHGNEYVCSCGQNGRIEVSKANADFIVTACNSHEELVEVLKLILHIAESYSGSWNMSFEKAHKILAKAQGETR